jgi:hypothetical protein
LALGISGVIGDDFLRELVVVPVTEIDCQAGPTSLEVVSAGRDVLSLDFKSILGIKGVIGDNFHAF